MLKKLSVKDLYRYALAEGEGVGTAYEYLAKRLVLARWLPPALVIRTVLIAGLPETYGTSMDFALLAAEFGAYLTVVDERPDALDKFESSLAAVREQGLLAALSWKPLLSTDISSLSPAAEAYDLAFSSEVLQRLDEAARNPYIANLQRLSSRIGLFCPNADNPSHTNLSGLTGLVKEELAGLVGHSAGRTGLIDMPPFPPGMTRTNEQREKAVSGRAEALAMSGLDIYARLERLIPERVRRRRAHIVYALIPNP
jgi:hypothetical protein